MLAFMALYVTGIVHPVSTGIRRSWAGSVTGVTSAVAADVPQPSAMDDLHTLAMEVARVVLESEAEDPMIRELARALLAESRLLSHPGESSVPGLNEHGD